LFFIALEPKYDENDGHNDGHCNPPTYEFIHNITPEKTINPQRLIHLPGTDLKVPSLFG
jgi:hypothetical protein